MGGACRGPPAAWAGEGEGACEAWPVGEVEGAAGGVAAAPAGGRELALAVLARRDEQRLGVDLGQAAHAELPQAMPLLGLAEERLE